MITGPLSYLRKLSLQPKRNSASSVVPDGTGDMRLSKNFTHKEFACKCGCGEGIVSNDLVNLVQRIRTAVGTSIRINSGIRCEKHNQAVGGTSRSWHIPREGVGRAADISYSNLSKHTDYNVLRLYTLADFFGAKGLGLYDNRVHVDVRDSGRARWIDSSWEWDPPSN